MRIFNEIFRKDVTYDNIKSHKKTVVHPFSTKLFFGKTTGGVKWNNPLPPPPDPPFLGLIHIS